MAHPSTWRSCRSRDETGHRLLAVVLNPISGFFFGGAPNLPNHNDAACFRVGIEHFYHVQVRGAVDGIATDSNASRLADTAAGELPNRLVGERATARDHTNLPPLVNVARRDADAAASVRVFAIPWTHHTGTVRSNQPGLLSVHRPLHLDHVIDGNAFRDADDQVEPGIDAFEDGIG